MDIADQFLPALAQIGAVVIISGIVYGLHRLLFLHSEVGRSFLK